MNNREVIPSGKMISRFIGNFIAWTIIMEIIIHILYAFIITQNNNDSVTTISVFYVITNIISIFLAAYLSSSMKKKAINSIDVSSVMMGIIIFFVVVALLDSLYNYRNIHSALDSLISSNPTLSYSDSFMEHYGTSEQKAEYNQAKNDSIAKLNSDVNTVLTAYVVSSLIMYGLMIPFVKRRLLSQSIE